MRSTQVLKHTEYLLVVYYNNQWMLSMPSEHFQPNLSTP
jgi:hypothetical protein